MQMILNIATISQLDVVEALKRYILQHNNEQSAIDAAYDFASELTGISVDSLTDYISKY